MFFAQVLISHSLGNIIELLLMFYCSISANIFPHLYIYIYIYIYIFTRWIYIHFGSIWFQLKSPENIYVLIIFFIIYIYIYIYISNLLLIFFFYFVFVLLYVYLILYSIVLFCSYILKYTCCKLSEEIIELNWKYIYQIVKKLNGFKVIFVSYNVPQKTSVLNNYCSFWLFKKLLMAAAFP